MFMIERKGLAVIDDDPDICKMVYEYAVALKLLNQLLIHGFTSGNLFLHFLGNNPSEVDAMLMDGKLGSKPNGIETAQMALEINPGLLLMGMSGESRYNAAFLRLGAIMGVDKNNLDRMLPCIFETVIRS